MNNTQKHYLFACVAFTLCLSGCGVPESEQDGILRQYNEKVNEIGTIYQSITDEDSARAAVPKIEQLATELTRFKQALDELPEVTEEEYQRAFDLMIEATKQTKEDTLSLSERMKANPKLIPILDPALKKLQAVFKNPKPGR